MLHSRKVRSEAAEKAHAKLDGENAESTIDSPAIHKDDLLDDEENEMSENESVGTQPEEVGSRSLIYSDDILILYFGYFRRKIINYRAKN